MVDRYKNGFIGTPVGSDPGSSTGLKSVFDQFNQNSSYSLPTNIPRNSLLLYLDYSSPSSYPGFGNGFRDLSGNNNNCRMSTLGTFINYKGGIMRSSSGSNIVMSTPITNVGTNNTTLIVWYKWNGTNLTGGNLYLGSSGTNGYGFYFNDGSNSATAGNRVSVLYGTVSYNALSGLANYSMVYGSWVCLILTRDTTTTSLYANGSLVGTTTSTPAGNSSTLSLSVESAAVGDYGLYAYYNRAFTQADVTAFYNGTRARFNNPVGASTYNIVKSGLTFHVDMSDINSYNINNPSYVYDVSGSGLEGTYASSSYAIPGPIDSVRLNGTSQYIDFGNTNCGIASGATAFSLCAWVNFTKFASFDGLLTRVGGALPYGGWELNINSSGVFDFAVNLGGTWKTYTTLGGTSYTAKLNTWYYVVGVFSSNTLYLYVNGSLVGSVATGGGTVAYTTVNNLRIGQNVTSYMGGYFGSASVYNTALSAADVLQNYNAQLPNYSPGPGAASGIVTSNLALNLDAANANSYVSGIPYWYDISGNGYIVPFPNGMNNQDPGSGYIYFNNTNIYGSMTQTSTFNFANIGGDFTVAAWIYIFGHKALNTVFGVWGQGGNNVSDNWIFSVNATGAPCFYWSPFSSNSPMLTGSTLSLNTWYYLTIARASNTFTMYINNASSVNTTNSSSNTSTYQLDIGRYGAPEPTSYYNGRIAAVHIYKGLGLSQSQVTQNYNAMKSRFGL